MKVIITKNYEEMSAKASRFVLAQIWRKPNSVLGLATGSTVIGMYQNLIEARKHSRADFSAIKSFNLDEYLGIDPKDKESYHAFMQKHLFDGINVKKQNHHVLNGNSENPDQECERYEQTIKQSGGIDLQILGLGQNSHIGFNEPGTGFEARTHVVELTESTRRANTKHFKNKRTPTHALTMGLSTIMDAKKILLVASGKKKASAVASAVEGRVNKEAPASLLQWHPDVTIILDEDAASGLKRDYASPFLFDHGDVEVLTENDLPKGKFITVISPHPDDASISLGAMISALAKRNRVHIIIMTTGYRSNVNGVKPEEVIKIREKEAREESKILGAKPVCLRAEFYDTKNYAIALKNDIVKLTKQFKRLRPDILFIPQQNDNHPTHMASREIGLSALDKYNPNQKEKISIYNYEGLWSLFSEKDFNTVFAFDDGIMKKKLKAISAQQSQIQRTRFDIAAKSLAQLRACVVPEQALVGYGAKAPKLGKYFELFKVT
ncbi:MAG: glucosamine-6-phosphate deaminase [Parcubacteria group bacterium CG_4_9_14_0_2_um_filter_41_8]|nr:MAG: glucosamine-6-phosphate deaminase [Parcubacteria group bacterium CG1_02_41_12]PIP67422.1 MAG: glucosamine-6-phosphate deaminase [Parcubacteria group bacterium CG22_combo_CG10-13_8_21_14_all_41_9]PIQ79365.1 MAG: glucosamine-6-phosphate deaminase [Parcubacteria group bacterium CG11_big_fil_rev_8_21_14_0_20_41_14]PIR56705.1 MAG: glucosamine-6-phosphate deaminase [Parcubacteria group bacterium CG10_big_fil_rev_8_21_14_0_10_41_35]PIZ81279.1 MAG: glucosamine-6-phosphate deaminase [Parcubacter